MRVAFVSDFHLGVSRFEQDAFEQAKVALQKAAEKGDVIVVCGDVFDKAVPKLETIEQAIQLFSSVNKPLYLIHGNHERRPKGFTNALSLLSAINNVTYVHGEVVDVGDVRFYMLGNVPEDLAKAAIEKMMHRHPLNNSKKNILVIHQSIKEHIFDPNATLHSTWLKNTGFDYVVCGHIHLRTINDNLLLPGSTVITQLKQEETKPRGFILLDLNTNQAEEITIPCRDFVLDEIDVSNKTKQEIEQQLKQKISEIRSEKPRAIIRFILKGKVKMGSSSFDISLDEPDVFVNTNYISIDEIKEQIKEIKEEDASSDIKTLAPTLLANILKDKVTHFDVVDLFTKLSEDRLDEISLE